MVAVNIVASPTKTQCLHTIRMFYFLNRGGSRLGTSWWCSNTVTRSKLTVVRKETRTMAPRDVGRRRSPGTAASAQVSTSTEALMLAAIERGEDLSKTGRFLVTYKENALNEGMKHLRSQRGLRIANARDFKDQAVAFEAATDADAVVFPEIGVALLSGAA